MAKDPAFLWYAGDWLGGTMTFTRHQKGCYIDLLMAQFNAFDNEMERHFTIEDIIGILGENDFNLHWEKKLKAKFKVDLNGKYFNFKLESEIIKRRKFTGNRLDNLKGKKAHMENHKDSHMGKHMHKHMENENEINISTNKDSVPEFSLPLKSVARTCWLDERWLESSAKHQSMSVDQIKSQLQVFVTYLESCGENYKALKDFKSHFNRWQSKKIQEAVALAKKEERFNNPPQGLMGN